MNHMNEVLLYHSPDCGASRNEGVEITAIVTEAGRV